MSLSEAFAGFLSGCINDTVLYHSDNLKYLQQNRQAIRPLKNLEDFRYHFRGAPIVVFGGGLSYAAFFYSYGLCKTSFEPRIAEKLDQNSAFSKFVLAGLSGALAIIPSTIVGFPFDQLKKHTASLPDLTFRQVGHKIYADLGLKGFYFGWNYTISRDIFMSGLKMSIFEAASKFCYNVRNELFYPKWLSSSEKASQSPLQKKSLSNTLESSVLTSREVAMVGLLSGLATALFSMPIDCIVSRMRSPTTPHEVKKSFFTVSKWMIEQDNSYIRPFFRGTGLRTFNYAVGSTVFWSAFNYTQKKTAPLFNPQI